MELKVIFDKGSPATLYINIVDSSPDISAVIDPNYGSFDKNIRKLPYQRVQSML
jgi:hypothetical protein